MMNRTMAPATIMAAAVAASNESNPQVSRTPSSRSRSPSPSTTASSHSTPADARTGSSTSSTADQHRRQASLVPAPNSECRQRDSAPKQQATDTSQSQDQKSGIELRLLVRRREAGALIGKRGTNIKRLRDTFRSSMFSIPDTGNGPERVVCLVTDERWMEPILSDITRLLVEKSLEKDDQIELKLLIHSSQAGSIIGMGGQSIKKLRNDSRAAIKIYELCCPFSNERVCAIKAKPPVVVATIKLIHSILTENPIKGTIKPYDALHFDLMLADKYGGYLPEEPLDFMVPPCPADQALHHSPYHHHVPHPHLSPHSPLPHHHHQPHHLHLQHQHQHNQRHFGNQVWRASEQHQRAKSCDDQVVAQVAQQLPEQQEDKHSKRTIREERKEETEDTSGRNNQASNGNGNRATARFHPYANGDYNRFATGDYPPLRPATYHHLALQQQRQALGYRSNLHQHMRQLPPGAQFVRMPASVFPYDRCRHRSMGACLCLFVPPSAQYMSPSPAGGGEFVAAIPGATAANFPASASAAIAKTGFAANERQR